jgi:hypothetical protein
MKKSRLIFRAHLNNSHGGYNLLNIDIHEQTPASYHDSGWYTSLESVIDLSWQSTMGEVGWYGFHAEAKSSSPEGFRNAADILARIQKIVEKRNADGGYHDYRNPREFVTALLGFAVEVKHDSRESEYVELKDIKPSSFRKYMSQRWSYADSGYDYNLGNAVVASESEAQMEILRQASEYCAGKSCDTDRLHAAIVMWVSKGMPVEVAHYSDAPDVTPALDMVAIGEKVENG